MVTYRQNIMANGENAPVEYAFVVPFSETISCSVGSDYNIEYFFVSADTGSDGIISEDGPNSLINCVVVDDIDTSPTAYIVQ